MQKWPPEKAAFNVLVEDTRRFNDVGKFGGALLGRCNRRLDLSPFPLDDRQTTFDFERAVGIPHIVEEHEHAETDQHHDADLERIALALSVFKNLLVEEVEMKCHYPVSCSGIQRRRRRRR